MGRLIILLLLAGCASDTVYCNNVTLGRNGVTECTVYENKGPTWVIEPWR